MRKVYQRVVLLVVDAVHDLLLPDQADALLEDFLAILAKVDVADRDRPGLAAGDRRVGWILEPVALLQTVDDAAVEIGDVTGDAWTPGSVIASMTMSLPTQSTPTLPTCSASAGPHEPIAAPNMRAESKRCMKTSCPAVASNPPQPLWRRRSIGFDVLLLQAKGGTAARCLPKPPLSAARSAIRYVR